MSNKMRHVLRSAAAKCRSRQPDNEGVAPGNWVVPIRSLFDGARYDGESVRVELNVMDFNGDNDPTVILNYAEDGTMCMTACTAERLGVFLLQAAAASRQVEPGGPASLVSEIPTLLEPVLAQAK